MQLERSLWQNSRYEIWWKGVLSPEQVTLQHNPADELNLSLELEDRIALHCQQARKQGHKVEPLPLYRTLTVAADSSGLRFGTGLCNYEHHLGMSALGIEQPAVVPLAVAAATMTDCGWVLEKRSARVAQGVGLLHVKPSGYIHPPATPWQALLQEAEEELALSASELQDPEVIGLIRNRTSECWGLVYRWHTPVRFPDLLRRRRIDDWESQELLALEFDPDELTDWLIHSFEKVTGIGHGAMLLAGWREFGDAWFEETCGSLSS